jgi:hypothetical protein
MIPGTVSKLSETNVAAAATIFAKSDTVRVTDTTSTTQLTTILPANGGFGQVCFLQNKSGASITLVTTGNIAGTGTITVLNQRMAVLVFSKLEGKWSVAQDT